MATLDTWNPNEGGLREEEVDSVVDTIAPAPLDIQRRMDDLVNVKRFLENDQKEKKGQCNLCEVPTSREFCGRSCETKAAFASMGKSLKFGA